eukprot:1159500-Pelagomonas_calceolata.AAC.28
MEEHPILKYHEVHKLHRTTHLNDKASNARLEGLYVAPPCCHAQRPATGAAPQTPDHCCRACNCTAPPAAAHQPAASAAKHPGGSK